MRGGVKCQRFGNDLVSFLTLAGPSRLDNSGAARAATDRREARSQLHYIVPVEPGGSRVGRAERAKLARGRALM